MASSNRSLVEIRLVAAGIWMLAVAAGIPALLASSVARADVVQTLDSVDIYDGSLSRPMRFDDTRAVRKTGLDYETSPVVAADAPAGFTSCQRAPNGDLICIDSDIVSRWVTTTERDANNVATKVVTENQLFTCAALGLDSRRGNPACLSFAVDVNGAIWIGGRKTNTAYSVLKISPVAQGTANTCPTPIVSAGDLSTTSDFCMKLYATGRPLITDMFAIDGEVAKGFKGPGTTSGAGVLCSSDGSRPCSCRTSPVPSRQW